MPNESDNIQTEDHVLFRVLGVSRNLLPPAERAFNDYTFVIERVPSGEREGYGVDSDTFLPFQHAIQEAAETQLVYWVNLDFSNQRMPPPPDDATASQRIL